jgi:signal peptidase I
MEAWSPSNDHAPCWSQNSMEKANTLRIYLKSLLYLFFVVVFWVTFAPRQVGGQYHYVIVSGNSMEPYLKNGDLVVVRPSKTYQVSDVILYRHPDLGSVIHRIMGVEGIKYIVQGDNNEWIDSYKPTQSEISGKLWFHIASAGKVIEQFRTPLGAALLAGILGIFVFWPLHEKSKE